VGARTALATYARRVGRGEIKQRSAQQGVVAATMQGCGA
jgi:hypothetical protein